MPRTVLLALAVVAPAAFLVTGGCSKSDNSKVSDALKMETNAAVKDAAFGVKTMAAGTWERIREVTYSKRSDFADDLESATRRMDEMVSDIKSRFAPDPPERAKAIREYGEARAELKVRLVDFANANTGNWSEARAQASRAWDKMTAAYDKATTQAGG